MLFRASENLVAEHPQLAEQILLVDEFLFARYDQVFRLTPAVDILDMGPGLLRRLLELYRTVDAIDEVKVWLCPEDDAVLELSDGGVLECDLCDNIYQPSECLEEVGYHVVQMPQTAPTEIPPRSTAGISLSKTDFEELTSILEQMPDFTSVTTRNDLLVGIFAGTPSKAKILNKIDLDGPPHNVAMRVITTLTHFGKDDSGQEALGILVCGLFSYMGSSSRADFLRGLLDRYHLMDSGGN